MNERIAGTSYRSRSHQRIERLAAFTLIELLVVISIIVLLLAILLPSLSKAREQAKQVVCASNLQGFGRGFYLYAGENRDYLCSGSFDPDRENGRDGPVDKVGWVADLVRFKFAFPGKQLCPSNPAIYNQKLRADPTMKEFYEAEEAIELIEKGFNSNYTQSWYMARTEYDPARAKKSPNGSNFKRRDTTVGPLRSTSMTRVAPATVPLLGDGKTAVDEELFGERCVKTMTDGPYGGPYGIQKYSDFGPAHGRGKWKGGQKSHDRELANVLFADGHVDVLKDRDGDGEFSINTKKNPPEQADLDRTLVFDGVLTLGRASKSPYTPK